MENILKNNKMGLLIRITRKKRVARKKQEHDRHNTDNKIQMSVIHEFFYTFTENFFYL